MGGLGSDLKWVWPIITPLRSEERRGVMMGRHHYSFRSRSCNDVKKFLLGVLLTGANNTCMMSQALKMSRNH